MPELPHSIFYYLLLLAMIGGVLASVPMGILFLMKRSGGRRVNMFFGLLLMSIGLTLFHHLLIITDFYADRIAWKFLPIYMTLSFPTLLFYYVKLSIYPSYKFRFTDIKHFILPVGQLIFFWFVFLNNVDFKSYIDRHFYNPFYGGMEQALFLLTFFAYMYFARRYVIHREAMRKSGEARKLWYLRKLIKGLFILFFIHATFALIDYFSFEIFRLNLRSVKAYIAMGALSFAALVYWLSVYGFQVLIWGQRLFQRQKWEMRKQG